MNIKLPSKIVKDIAEATQDDKLASLTKWAGHELVDLNIGSLTNEQIQLLTPAVQQVETADKWKATAIKTVEAWKRISKDPTGAKCTQLKNLETILRIRIELCKNKWLFQQVDGNMLPFFVERISYEPYNAHKGNEANVTIRIRAFSRHTETKGSIKFQGHQLAGGKTAEELLNKEGFYTETPELVAEYTRNFNRYTAIQGQTGEQFTASGSGYEYESRYLIGKISMERDGVGAKCVIDDIYQENERTSHEKERTVSSAYWTGTNNEETVTLPTHPYIKVFDLQKHRFIVTHASNLKEYQYDTALAEKLVFSHEKKELVEMLINDAGAVYEDIIEGKSGGIIVMATGAPGLGKTLTAEVYSEHIKRPLYTVQCSQLGTDEQSLEKNLLQVLNRATRWKAILLIDEADVYIHSRGNNIQQNAIVGVFLRVLEYYRGILFMTSNRETVIDDAIMSRVTAHVKYTHPNKGELCQIWKILATQCNWNLPENVIPCLIEEFPNATGRNVKMLLKLTQVIRKKQPNRDILEIFKFAAKFIEVDQTR
jgi:hypothetical protein